LVGASGIVGGLSNDGGEFGSVGVKVADLGNNDNSVIASIGNEQLVSGGVQVESSRGRESFIACGSTIAGSRGLSNDSVGAASGALFLGGSKEQNAVGGGIDDVKVSVGLVNGYVLGVPQTRRRSRGAGRVFGETRLTKDSLGSDSS
jgi:hypothetical protein